MRAAHRWYDDRIEEREKASIHKKEEEKLELQAYKALLNNSDNLLRWWNDWAKKVERERKGDRERSGGG